MKTFDPFHPPRDTGFFSLLAEEAFIGILKFIGKGIDLANKVTDLIENFIFDEKNHEPTEPQWPGLLTVATKNHKIYTGPYDKTYIVYGTCVEDSLRQCFWDPRYGAYLSEWGDCVWVDVMEDDEGQVTGYGVKCIYTTKSKNCGRFLDAFLL